MSSYGVNLYNQYTRIPYPTASGIDVINGFISITKFTGDTDISPDDIDNAVDAISLAGSMAIGTGSVRRKSRLSIAASLLPSETDDEEDKEVSLIEIMRMNSPEWPFMVLGVFAATIVGLTTPIYGILFGEVLGVLSPLPPEYLGGLSQEEKQQEGSSRAN